MSNAKIILMIIFILILIFVILFIFSNDSNVDVDSSHNIQSKLRYSYGLFSNDEMSEYMKETIRVNSETTKLEYEVIGPTELAKDMVEAKTDVPFILDIYAAIPRGAAKSDLARMVTLYVRGGHYADLDVRFKTIPPIQENRVIVYSELSYTPPFVGLANYAISSSPKHPFILMVINEISNRVLKMKGKEKWTEQDVLNTTGPNVLSDVYKAWKEKKEELFRTESVNYRVSKLGFKTSRSILIHEAAGTWRNDKDKDFKLLSGLKKFFKWN